MSALINKQYSMNLYHYLTNNREVLRTLLKTGLISTNIPGELEMYRFYSDMLSLGETKSMSRESSIKRFKINRRKFYRILERMEAVVA